MQNYYAGREIAHRSVAAAERFSHLMGGADGDVKEYFFSLKGKELKAVLDEYGKLYGNSARAYARQAIHKWQTGQTRMSGQTAIRLFDLVPQFMPLQEKFNLAEKIWLHYGPSSSHTFAIGKYTNLGALDRIISDKLDQTITSYNIPDPIKKCFAWLSAGDVALEEQLLNHFRQREKETVRQKIALEVPILQQQVQQHGLFTASASTSAKIQQHTINIRLNKKFTSEIVEVKPPRIWPWFLALGLLLVFIISSTSDHSTRTPTNIGRGNRNTSMSQYNNSGGQTYSPPTSQARLVIPTSQKTHIPTAQFMAPVSQNKSEPLTLLLGNTPPRESDPIAGLVVPPQKMEQMKIVANGLYYVRVIRVVDGDTLEVRFNETQIEKVRLIGVDTPETVHPQKAVQHYGKEASAYTKRMLTNKKVWLQMDVQIRDRYQRLLAYAWIEKPNNGEDEQEIRSKMYNARLLLDGYCQVMTIQPNSRYADLFTQFQKEARERNKGLWEQS